MECVGTTFSPLHGTFFCKKHDVELRLIYNLQSLTKFYYYLKKNKFISQEFPEIIYFLQEIDECFKTCRRYATTHSKKSAFI